MGRFVPAPTPTLAVHTAEGVWLRTVTGDVQEVPAGLSAPVLLGSTLFALFHHPRGTVLWHDGICELLPGGALRSFAPLADGSLVALSVDWNGRTEALLRSPAGKWSTFGSVPLIPTMHASDGQVALLSFHQGAVTELSLHFPDLARSEVIRRWSSAPARTPTQAIPTAPRLGSRFSTAEVIYFDFESRILTLDQPVTGFGHHRLQVATLPQAKGCTPASGAESHPPPPTSFVRTSSPTFALLGKAPVFVWVEEEGTCRYRFVEKEPVSCPGAPCIDTPPAHWEPYVVTRHARLVLHSVERELGHIFLSDSVEHQDELQGVSMTSGAGRLFVSAWGHLLELDVKAIEERL